MQCYLAILKMLRERPSGDLNCSKTATTGFYSRVNSPDDLDILWFVNLLILSNLRVLDIEKR